MSTQNPNVTPEQIHAMADKFKSHMRRDLDTKEAELGEVLVDCFAAILVKLCLVEHHLEDIAYSQRIIAERQV